MMWRWTCILALGVLAGGYAYLRSSTVFLDNAMGLAQIVGVFAGLGLTAISIMAALPLEGWVRKARRTDHKVAKDLVEGLTKLPDQFRRYLVSQLLAIAGLVVIGLLAGEFTQTVVNNAKVPLSDSCLVWLAALSGLTGILSTHCCLAAWDTFSLLHTITSKSVDRYREEGLNTDAPNSTVKADDVPEEKSVRGTTKKS